MSKRTVKIEIPHLWENLDESVRNGISYGGVVYVLSLLILLAASVGRTSNYVETVNARYEGEFFSVWKLTGWTFYQNHFVPIDIVSPALGENPASGAEELLRNLITLGFVEVISLLSPILLAYAGYRLVGRTERTGEHTAFRRGGLIALGYTPLFVLGAYVLQLTIRAQGSVLIRAGPDMVSAVLVGIVWPAFFGGVGGVFAVSGFRGFLSYFAGRTGLGLSLFAANSVVIIHEVGTTSSYGLSFQLRNWLTALLLSHDFAVLEVGFAYPEYYILFGSSWVQFVPAVTLSAGGYLAARAHRFEGIRRRIAKGMQITAGYALIPVFVSSIVILLGILQSSTLFTPLRVAAQTTFVMGILYPVVFGGFGGLVYSMKND